MAFMKRLTFRDMLFELLYLAVCIATFGHTAYACSLIFQGAEPLTNSFGWHLEGALIAIAVDVGMLVVSRLLGVAVTTWQRVTLIATFIIAAVISFYAQVTYIVLFTPQLTMSAGVSTEWAAILKPFLDARVILLPLALPLLATVFTLARLAHHGRSGSSTPVLPKRGSFRVARPDETDAEAYLLLPFSCPHCDKRFRSRGGLGMHLRTHENLLESGNTGSSNSSDR